MGDVRFNAEHAGCNPGCAGAVSHIGDKKFERRDVNICRFCVV